MRSLATALVLFFSCQALAQQPEYACIFKKPFIFGASITAGYGGLKDGASGALANQFNQKYFGKNLDPITRMAQGFDKKAEITNIAEMIPAMKFGAFGYLQLHDAVQNPELLTKLRQSSVIASVDAFYWVMAYGRCSEALDNLDWIIRLAQSLRKPLILATVPIEDGNTIDYIVRSTWTAPNVECTNRFNQRLLNTCLPQNDCFVADIADTVVKLNSTGIFFQGKLNKINDFRFDGVHLTLAGNQWIQKLVSDVLSQGRFNCR